jgi:hypothetical protein
MIGIEDAVERVVVKMREDSNVQALTISSRFPVGEFPSFWYGRRMEVANRVTLAKKSPSRQYKVYPMVYLQFNNTPEQVNGLLQWSLNVFLIHKIAQEKNFPARMDENVRPVLDVLYQSFLDCLPKAGVFLWDGLYPTHRKIEQPNWGTSTSEKNVKHLFNDSVDAIEINGLRVNQRIKNC